MKPNPTHPQLSDPGFDRALSPGSDSILPSSGFADSVMTAVAREAAAPAPIAFPWKRALPGFVAAGAMAIVLIVAVVALLRPSAAASVAPSVDLQAVFAPVVHHATAALWLTVSLLIAVASLLFCRRLISTN
ncbi:MAG: hypothetical protein ABSA94_12655 [Acidobacteriaceae bacterium]|jgi:hypothetical protein